MDILSIIGIAFSLIAILGGNFLEGGHIGSLLQLTAFVIVFGGTLGAVLLQTPMSIMDITIACGFQSPPHFSKCYRSLFGYPPSAERRLAR